jgi:hypothetical protein
VIQREAIVTLGDSIPGVGECQRRGGKFFGRVLVGAGGSRRVERALCLLHLLVRGFAAAADVDDQRKTQGRQQTRAQGHRPQYTRTLFAVVR